MLCSPSDTHNLLRLSDLLHQTQRVPHPASCGLRCTTTLVGSTIRAAHSNATMTTSRGLSGHCGQNGVPNVLLSSATRRYRPLRRDRSMIGHGPWHYSQISSLGRALRGRGTLYCEPRGAHSLAVNTFRSSLKVVWPMVFELLSEFGGISGHSIDGSRRA